MRNKEKKACRTSIGGQAVLEGVMMRGKTSMATAVRDQEGVIRLEAERLKPSKGTINKIPILRGAVNLFVSMVTGVKILSRSAEVYGADDSEPSKFEKWLAKTFKIDIMSVVMFFGVVLGLAFSIGLFFFIPHILGNLFKKYVTEIDVWRNLFEGVLRILIFVLYILLTSLIKDMRRTYMYHGAEHKTITCFEKGLPLTVENVRSCRRVHDRCGTTFMFFVMFVSVFVFTFFGLVFPMITEGALKFLVKIALLPLIAGISYELLKLLAKTDSPVVFIFKLPGLLLQKLTTREPTDDMIEVAITSFNKVLKMDKDPNEPECKFVCPEKLSSLLERIKKEFSEKGIDLPDAEWIISVVTGIKRSEMGEEKTISASNVEKIDKFVKERLTGKPLCYVLGTQDFYGFEIKTDKRALIPRAETEELVALAVGEIDKSDRVLDLCTGSGAIAVAVKSLTGASVTASDISEAAISLAEENAVSCGVEIDFTVGDMFENVEGKFNVIISNPPYIKSEDINKLQTEVKDFEPLLALDGGEDGLKYYRVIAEKAKDYLTENGKLFLEIGFEEGDDVAELLSEDFNVEVIKDMSGNDRIVKAELK